MIQRSHSPAASAAERPAEPEMEPDKDGGDEKTGRVQQGVQKHRQNKIAAAEKMTHEKTPFLLDRGACQNRYDIR